VPGPDSISVQTISEFPIQKERKKESKGERGATNDNKMKK
jgi:hypothetical protein